MLAVELVGPSWRVFCGVVIEFFFVAGELLLAVLAWWLRYKIEKRLLEMKELKQRNIDQGMEEAATGCRCTWSPLSFLLLPPSQICSLVGPERSPPRGTCRNYQSSKRKLQGRHSSRRASIVQVLPFDDQTHLKRTKLWPS